ncbi:glycoside hydrolase family 43 protein [Humibacter sp. RRB41]|uniref:glycoside hydrolase family 43 protein n=1 Tax=Humibacter sp. RRB41 TaxID=2919946 RepID=UPI001FAABDF6|nr:glycoside hydrolase family 43 protein [Humibacter sp. RRB41]
MNAPGRVPINPILPGFYPDPSICRVGDRYLLANSTFEYLPGIPLHESTDLIHWHPIGSAVTRPEAFGLETARDSGGLYAPTIRFHDGVYYLVGSQVDRGPDAQFILTASDPSGPWSDPVWVRGAEGFDPSIFFHGDAVYWCAARPAEPAELEGQTEIWVHEVDVATGRLLGDETVVWRGAARDAVWSEGPHLFERDGWFYLLTAEGGTYRDHAVVIARSRSVSGPYEGCPRNPILTHRHLGGTYPVQNVGHADLVERQDGTWAAVVLGVRVDGGRHILGRETFLAEVTWEDGWPVVNPGEGVLRDVGDRADVWAQHPPRADGALTVRGAADFAKETADGVVLTTPVSASGTPRRPSGLFHRLTHRAARMRVDFAEISPGAIAGLALRQSDTYSIRAEVDDGSVRVIERVAGVDTEHDSWTVDDAKTLSVVAELDPAQVRFRLGSRSSVPIDTAVLSSEVAGGFVGTVWGPFVAGAAGSRACVTGVGYRGLGSVAGEAS